MKEKMAEMMDMLGEKKSGKMGEQDIQAKIDVLKELLGEAESEIRRRVKGGMDSEKAMKVSVMADSPEDLKEGLEKAEELTSEMPEMTEEAEEVDHTPKADVMQDEEEKEEPKMSLEDEEEEESFFSKKKSKA